MQTKHVQLEFVEKQNNLTDTQHDTYKILIASTEIYLPQDFIKDFKYLMSSICIDRRRVSKSYFHSVNER